MRSWHRLIFAIILLTLTCGQLFAAPQEYMQVRIYIDALEEIRQLRTMHLDVVWQADQFIEIVTDSEELAELRDLGFRTEVIHEDLTAFYRSRFVDIKQTQYLSLSAIQQEMNFLWYLYPDLITERMSIGQTIEGRDIYAVKISDNPDIDEDEPEILYTSAIHAREGITPLVLLHFMYYILENYGTDPEATYLIDNREMWFVLCVNPDGYAWNDLNHPGGGGMWRKNRRDNGDGTFGVDLNRNFGYMWGYDNAGSSPVTEDETYRGTGPFSEPESQVMRDFTIAHDFQIAIYYHSYSNLILYPWGYLQGLYTDDHDLFYALADSITTFNNYTPQIGWALYPTNGDTDDWYYGEQTIKDKIFSFTPEVGDYLDGFWPEESRIPDLVAENLQPNLLWADLAGHVHDILWPDQPQMICPDSVDIDEPYEVSWTLDDTLNPAVSYELVEMQGLSTITETCDDLSNLTNNGFEHVSYGHSGYGFWSGDPIVKERYVQSIHPYTVQPNDTLKFWTFYDISPNWDFAYVEISTDGKVFATLPGNITTMSDWYHHNKGNGITGSSEGWIEGLFDLSAYEGQDIYVRFSYKDHHLWYAWYGIIIDDIYPISSFETVTVLSSSLTDTSYAISGKPQEFYYYKVRAVDAQDQWRPFSTNERVIVGYPQEYYCGDANGNRDVELQDCTYVLQYIFGIGPAPDDLIECDADGCGSINLSDVIYITDYLYSDGPAPCSSTVDCILPTTGNSVELGCPGVIVAPEQSDSVSIPVYITNAVPIAGLSLGLAHNSEAVEISSVSSDGSILPYPQFFSARPDLTNDQVFLTWTSSSLNALPAQQGGLLATLWVRVMPGTAIQTIDIDSVFIAPAGEFIFSAVGGGSIVPGYNDCGTEDIMIVGPFLCGDADGSEAVNLVDVTFIINYLYKEGPAPEPFYAADANGDRGLNILDATHLINYLYKEGPEPICL